MYEQRHVRPLTHAQYVGRLARHAAAALGLMILSLVIGMAGYEYFEDLAWRDAFLDAAMLLGGMGPVHTPVTPGGKLFAGCYALYAGIVFLVAAGLLLAPVVHRLLHRFHWEEKEK